MPLCSLAIATRPEALAEALIARLAERPRLEDTGFASPPRLVVPNPGLGTWLKLRIARALGVAMHLESCFLEEGLWRTLAELDPGSVKPRRLGREQVRQMVLAVLLGPGEAAGELAPLVAYTRNREGQADPRKAWQLSGRLAGLLRDYSYHRPELVAAWLRGEGRSADGLEAAEGALYRMLFGEGGLRDRWQAGDQAELLTLSEYASRILTGPAAAPADGCLWIFGTSQISPFHVELLAGLGELMQVRLYIPSALAAPLEEQGLEDAERRKRLRDLTEVPPAGEAPPWREWAGAGREALHLLESLLEGPFELEVPGAAIPPKWNGEEGNTALERLQALLLGTRDGPLGPADETLRIAACPGIQREVESVRESILWNLGQDPGSKLSDIAVLVPDMARYRPVLQAVFERGPEPIPYALADHGVGAASRYGEALLDLLELASGSAPRSLVFRLLLNPCLLAGMGLDRETVLCWSEWSETLGIRRFFDPQDRESRGGRGEDLYTWRQGLRRLRLGRILASSAEGGLPWQGIDPPGDLGGADVEGVDRFSAIVETLIRKARRLAAPDLGCRETAALLDRLAAEFLAVPADRPAEERVRVRARILLAEFGGIDALLELSGGALAAPWSLLAACLRELLEEPDPGRFLTGGVTLASPQPARPIPFEVVYLLGLGEGGPPSQASSLDLRAGAPRRGDVGPVEASSHLFLEALLSARRKLYLSYDCLDLEKDQALHPGPLLGPLLDRLKEGWAGGAYPVVRVPLRAGSASLAEDNGGGLPAPPRGFARLLALQEGLRSGRIALQAPARARVEEALSSARFELRTPPGAPLEAPAPVRIADLAGFLKNPIQAALPRRLGLYPERERVEQDDEPFTTGRWAALGIAEETLRRLSMGTGAVSREWPGRFEELYQARTLASRAPEGAFAGIDRSRLAGRLDRRFGAGIEEPGLANLLERGERFVRLLMGQEEPGEGRLVLPGLELEIPGIGSVRLQGSFPFARKGAEGLEYLVLIEKLHESRPFPPQILAPFLLHLCLGGRSLVHVSHRQGLASWRLRAIESGRARAYLEDLLGDFLGPGAFDLLPLAPILEDPELWGPLKGEQDVESEARFPELLREAIEQGGEDRFPAFRLPDLVAASSAEVPGDAWAKVRRRFGPLLECLDPLERDS